eukprot:scaffold32973_cov31-Tisochrysis_lutea.AAC.3
MSPVGQPMLGLLLSAAVVPVREWGFDGQRVFASRGLEARGRILEGNRVAPYTDAMRSHCKP